MDNKTISMQKTRQMLRFRSQGKGIQNISGLIGLCRYTVKKHLARLEELGVSYESALALSDLYLQTLLQPPAEVVPLSSRSEILQSLLPTYCKRLKRKGVAKEILHQEYKAKYPDGYSRPGFCRLIRLFEFSHSPVMHLDHKQAISSILTLQARSCLS